MGSKVIPPPKPGIRRGDKEDGVCTHCHKRLHTDNMEVMLTTYISDVTAGEKWFGGFIRSRYAR